CYYLFVFTIVAVAAAAASRPEAWWGDRARQVWFFMALAGALAAAAMFPFLLPYRSLGQVRSLHEVAMYSATWRDYLTTPAWVHHETWSARWFSATGLFPGIVGPLLAMAGIALGT